MKKKKKTHRIGNSKIPTPEIMMKIADNISSMRSREYVCVKVETVAFLAYQRAEIKYGIYTETLSHRFFKTWPDLITYYRILMKGDIKDV